MTRSKLRLTLILISLLIFPITMNYFSPYVSIDGAFNGVIAASVVVFGLLFLSGMFFRRAWCAYICPVAGLAEAAQRVNPKPVNRKVLRIIRYTVFGIWFSVLITGFVVSGLKGFDLLHLTESGISVDQPLKYITYLMVVGILTALTLLIGRRGACHSICWMSPFLSAGAWVGSKLHLPQVKIEAQPERCISCGKCDKVCPMSITVMNDLKKGSIMTQDCIQCGQCEEVCPKSVLSLKWFSTKQ